MGFEIMEVDGVVVNPNTKKFPVEVTPEPHEMSGPMHTGKVAVSQLPDDVMFDTEHQNDPHTMIIDGRDVSVDGLKLDTIETNAEVNNLTDQQANSLTGGTHSNWHTHDDWYYRKTQLQTSGEAQVIWANITNTPTSFPPTQHDHDDRYYTETELDNGQLDNRYFTETEITTNYYTKTQLDNGQLDNRYFTENEITTNYYTKSNLDTGQLDNRYYTETETDILIQAASFGISGSVNTFADLPTTNDDGIIYIVKTTVGSDEEGFYRWDGSSWIFLANNTGVSLHNSLPDLNTGNYIHLDIHEYELFDILTSGGDTILHSHDLRYYRRDLIDDLLDDKSDITHTHDDRYYTETEMDVFLNNKSNIGHLHDDRYYTETEIDNILNNYSLTNHIHDNRYYTQVELQTSGQSSVNWDNITNSPTSFPPGPHNHDDRYYTETELQSSGQSSVNWDNLTNVPDFSLNHNHDTRYYTQTELDSLFNAYYDKTELDGGQLDNRYYTETEIDTLLSNKSDITHTHDDRYFTETEITTNYYNKTSVDTLISAASYGISGSVNTFADLPTTNDDGIIYIVKNTTGSDEEGFYRWDGSSWVFLANNTGITTHGGLPDLLNDDHPQYTEHDDSESITGDWTFTNGKLTLPSGSSLPAGTHNGETYWYNNELYIWNGSAWISTANNTISVYSNSTLNNNAIMLGDDGVRGIKESQVTITNGNVAGVEHMHITRDGNQEWLRLDHTSGNPDLGTILVYKYLNARTTMVLSDYDDGPIIKLQQTGTGDETNPQYSSEISMSSSTSNMLFKTGNTNRFEIENNGTLKSLNTSYENLVTSDDDIPNKKYVDDSIITDHSLLSNLNNDDHPQYLNESRHDSLANDNPHSVSITQTIAVDPNTDITTTELEDLTNGSNTVLHNHDSRYYTETEIDTLLNGYSLISHTHDDRYYTETEIDTLLSNKSDITHTHDDRYYTETEIDNTLANYSLITHTHDDRYFTETEITTNYYNKTSVDSLIQAASFGISGSVNTFADLPTTNDDGIIYIVKTTVGSNEEGFYRWDGSSWIFLANNTGTTLHNSLSDLNTGDYIHLTSNEYNGLTNGTNTTLHIHDDRYYTETEIDNTLTNYSLITHNHDDRYYTKNEINSNFYTASQLNSGSLDNRYYTETELNIMFNNYSLTTHTHDDRYYTENEMDVFLGGKANVSHNHDNRYYTETEIDTLLSNKSDITHTHDNRYFTEVELSSSNGASLIGNSAISGLSATNVQDALEEINSNVNTSNPTWDDLYSNGHIITVDSGPLIFDVDGANSAPIEIESVSSPPSSGLGQGQISIINGELYIYDSTRSKWLASSSHMVSFGKNNAADGSILYLIGNVRDNNAGYKMIRDCTIVGMSLNTTNTVSNKNVYIRINGSTDTTIQTDSNGNYLNNLMDIDLDSGDNLSIRVSSSGFSIQDAICMLEIKWRA